MTSALERAAQIAAIGVNATVEASGLAAELQRPAALYLLVTCLNLPGATVALVAGCSKQNVSKHLKRVEDARSDRAVDLALDRIEAKLLSGRL